ncbi:hypothetical protein F4692_003868 [Nocardioides cavernae]|uniref:Ankyrin repeat domain-containing protein n=1 Tax=Nocardioides cavernae TaxID=1921566 RepID=A0A7Y9H6Q3_9ACTN|nr:hypothetical protein [Nocardioides cavernae]NYE38718.1 hypothetical protein [Nocardioides cavernae]
MGLFNRSKPRDTDALHAALTHGTLAELEKVYEPAWVDLQLESGTLLTLALSNKDTAQRVAMANRLLDDGADVTKGQPLHVLLGRNQHDFTAEAPLLARMLDAGADVNEGHKKFGTPLETIAAKFKFSDADLAPFYDVLLARPDLDLLQDSIFGRTVLGNLRHWSGGRGELVVRAEQTLTDRGIPVPPPAQ